MARGWITDSDFRMADLDVSVGIQEGGEIPVTISLLDQEGNLVEQDFKVDLQLVDSTNIAQANFLNYNITVPNGTNLTTNAKGRVFAQASGGSLTFALLNQNGTAATYFLNVRPIDVLCPGDLATVAFIVEEEE